MKGKSRVLIILALIAVMIFGTVPVSAAKTTKLKAPQVVSRSVTVGKPVRKFNRRGSKSKTYVVKIKVSVKLKNVNNQAQFARVHVWDHVNCDDNKSIFTGWTRIPAKGTRTITKEFTWYDHNFPVKGSVSVQHQTRSGKLSSSKMSNFWWVRTFTYGSRK